VNGHSNSSNPLHNVYQAPPRLTPGRRFAFSGVVAGADISRPAHDRLEVAPTSDILFSDHGSGACTMPQNVVIFERLMYASVCIGLLNLILDGPRQAELPDIQALGGMVFVAGVVLATLAIILLLMWLIVRKRKNWARLLFAIMFVLGLWPTIQNVSLLLDANPAVALLSVAQIVIQGAALFFIFTGDAPSWFETAKPA
jgi:hypothetical protein